MTEHKKYENLIKNNQNLIKNGYTDTMTKEKVLAGIKVFGISLLFGSFLAFGISFVQAYLHETKSAIITINEYNEANLEMWIIFPLTLIFGSLALIIEVLNYRKLLTKEVKDEK